MKLPLPQEKFEDYYCEEQQSRFILYKILSVVYVIPRIVRFSLSPPRQPIGT